MPLYSPRPTRWPYDLDGTVGFLYDGATVTTLSNATLQTLNREKSGAGLVVPGGGSMGLLFPRDASANQVMLTINSVLAFGSGAAFVTEVSGNTTTGVDGAWLAGGSDGPTAIAASPPDPVIRTAASTAVGGSGFAAVRLRAFSASSFTLQALHLFAQFDVGGGLAINPQNHGKWLIPSGNGSSGNAMLDMGDTLRGNTYTTTCFLVNPWSQTANNVVLSFDSPTGGDPGGLGEHQVKVGSGSYGSTATITSIAPGATSPQITVQRAVGGSALLGPWVYRLVSTVGSWT